MQERGEVGEFEVGRDVAQSEGGFPTDCGAWFLRRELRNEGNDVLSGIAEGAEGEQSLLRVWTVGEYRVNDLEPLIAEEREEPDGAGLNVFVGMVEELADRGDGLGPGGLESLEADEANVLGGVGKEGDRALNGFGIGLRNARLESLGGDAVDSSRTRLVVVAMATDSGVEPIGNVERTVGTDHHIGRAKEVASLALDEVGTVEFESRVFEFRVVAEDDLAAGFTAEEQSGILGRQSTVFVEANPRGRTAAVDVAGWQDSRVRLSPLGFLNALTRALIRFPTALAVG